jgi:hypothetical protein
MEALSHPPAPLRGRAMRDFGGAGELEASSASSLTGFSSRTGRGSEAGSGGATSSLAGFSHVGAPLSFSSTSAPLCSPAWMLGEAPATTPPSPQAPLF